jgi:uncharacterized protein (DUF2141 family)
MCRFLIKCPLPILHSHGCSSIWCPPGELASCRIGVKGMLARIPYRLAVCMLAEASAIATEVSMQVWSKAPEKGGAMSVQCVAWLAVVVLANLPAVALAQSSSCPGIQVQILNIRNSTGTVDCALFDAPEGFPIEVLRSATNVMVIKVRHTQARCDFADIPPGTYALAVIHDENMNGKLDTISLGIPTEGYGFSNDAKGSLGAPSFSAASFAYDGRNLELTIRLQY